MTGEESAFCWCEMKYSDMSVKFIHSRVQSKVSLLVFCLDQQSPTFLAPGIAFVGDNFPMREGGCFGMMHAHDIYCALYFYYCYISPASDHQALALRGWGPLVWTMYPLLSVEHWSPLLLLFCSKGPTNEDDSAALFKVWLPSAGLSLPSCFRLSILLETLLKHSLPDDYFTLGQTEPEVSELHWMEMSVRCWNLYTYIHACVHQLFSHIQLCDRMDYSLPSFSAHGIFQARILECLRAEVSLLMEDNLLVAGLLSAEHWKRLWCWEGLGAGGEGDDRGWDGWMASLTRWTWVWVNSRS